MVLIMHGLFLGSVVALVGLCSARPAPQNNTLNALGLTQGFPAEYLPLTDP